MGAVMLAVLFLIQLGLAFFYQASPTREIAVLTAMAWVYLALAVALLLRNARQVPLLLRAAWAPLPAAHPSRSATPIQPPPPPPALSDRNAP